MTRIFFLFLALLTALSMLRANAQQSISDLSVKRLKLPSETLSGAAYVDGTGQLKSSSAVSSTELGHLDGVTSAIQGQIDGTVKTVTDQTIAGNKTFTGKMVVSSTTTGSKPCPEMTEAQRDAVASPQNGDCIFNSTAGTINIYSSTDLAWNEVSGSGGGDPGILTNGGFEKGIASWTLASGTASFTTTDKIELKQALDIALTAQTLSLKQISTLNASALSGLQGLAYAYIKAPTGAVIKLCAIQNSVTSTTLCHTRTADGTRQLYKIPFILNGTNNGLEILSTAAITGTVNVDKAWVGAVDLKVDSQGGTFLASKSIPVSCGDTTTTSTTFVTASAFSGSCTPTTAGATSDTTRTPSIALNTYPAGRYLIHVKGALYAGGTNHQAYIQVTDGTRTSQRFGVYSPGTTYSGSTYVFEWTNNSSATSANISVQMATSNAASTAGLYTSGITSGYEISVYHYPTASSSTYSSTNADTDWAACSFSTLAWQGLGTVDASGVRCKRQGSELLMRGRLTIGTVAASEARIPLPTWNGNQLSLAGLTNIPITATFGRIVRSSSTSTATKDHGALATASQQYLTISVINDDSAANPLVSQTGTALFASGEAISLENVRIPIEGWEQSNIIIGQFNGLESCTDSYQCTDTFSAKITSAGAIQEENIDWITSCTSPVSGAGTCTLKTGLTTQPMNCVSTTTEVTNQGYVRVTPSATTLTYQAVNTSGAGANQGWQIICQKQGADYIGKTAKAVASDQNVRSIGAVGVDIQSVYFGLGASCTTTCTTSPCAICSQVGSKVTQVTREGAGIYRINGIDGTKYICFGNGDSTSQVQFDRANSTTSYVRMLFRTGSPALADVSSSSVTCIGVP